MPADVRKYYRKATTIIEVYQVINHDPQGIGVSIIGDEEGEEVNEQEYLDQENARIAAEEEAAAAELAEKEALLASALSKATLTDLTPAEFINILRG